MRKKNKKSKLFLSDIINEDTEFFPLMSDEHEENNEHDYGDDDICELVNSNSRKNKELQPYPDKTLYIL